MRPKSGKIKFVNKKVQKFLKMIEIMQSTVLEKFCSALVCALEETATLQAKIMKSKKVQEKQAELGQKSLI